MIRRLLAIVAGLLACAVLAPAAQALAAPGAISGKVSEGGGFGVPNIDVCALVASNPTEIGGCVRSEGGGVYTIGNLAPGKYKVEFFPERASGYLREYWNNKRNLASAEEVTVSEGTTTPNIDATLELAPEIKGTVTDAGTAEPIKGIVACAREKPGSGVFDRCAETGADGRYVLNHLQFESDTVEFWAPNELDYVTQFWNGQASFAAAQGIALAPETTVSNVNAQLSHGGFIEGRITDATTGAPLSEIWACVFSAAEAQDRCGRSNASGVYKLAGQAAGFHKVGFSLEEMEEDGYAEQYYVQQPTLAAATPISVGAPFSTTTGIDARLVNKFASPGTNTSTSTSTTTTVVVQPEQHRPITCPKKKRKKVVKGKPRCVKKKHRRHHKHHRHGHHRR